MSKTSTIKIKDLPILNYEGKTYYALNTAVKYIKQNNPLMKNLTMKKVQQEYETLKLRGCGTWITVELFNELSCKLTKVVVKTLDQTIEDKESGACLGELFFVRDEATRLIYKRIVADIPKSAMEEVVKFEEYHELKDGKELLENIKHLIKVTKDFRGQGYNVKPYLYENGHGYLIGDGVFLKVDNWGYDYELFLGSEWDMEWESDKIGKICCYVDKFQDVPEHMEEFVPMNIDFTNMSYIQAIITCWNQGLISDEYDYLVIKGSNVTIDHDVLLKILGGEPLQERLVDLSLFIEDVNVVDAEYKEIN